jgi:1-acyl-sn-glycerol-3-phosphate acyltransferase
MSKNPPQMSEFKAGAFKLAVDTKVPILPITFRNNYKLMRGSGTKYGSRPGIMRAYVHKPIDTSAYETQEDLERLSKQIYEVLNSKLS